MNDAKRVAKEFHDAFTPTKVEATGLECVANLTSETNTPDVLRAVDKWHNHPRRRYGRHKTISSALLLAASA